MLKLALLGAAVLSAASAQAVTVDFDELTPFDVYESPLVSGGLLFENEGAGGGIDAFYAVGDGWYAGASGTQLIPNYFGSSTTVSLAAGGLFDLISFDFGDAFDFADDPVLLTLTFQTTGGEIVLNYVADFVPGLQTVDVGVTGISSFTLVTSGSFFGEDTVGLDNIVYTASGDGPVVPEPATWAMMVSGFGLMGVAMRRRRSAAGAIHTA